MEWKNRRKKGDAFLRRITFFSSVFPLHLFFFLLTSRDLLLIPPPFAIPLDGGLMSIFTPLAIPHDILIIGSSAFTVSPLACPKISGMTKRPALFCLPFLMRSMLPTRVASFSSGLRRAHHALCVTLPFSRSIFLSSSVFLIPLLPLPLYIPCSYLNFMFLVRLLGTNSFCHPHYHGGRQKELVPRSLTRNIGFK